MKDEKQIAEEYRQIYRATGLSESEAQEQAPAMIARAKEIVRQQGLDQGPPNKGDVALLRASTDEQVRRKIELLRPEGVTDEDIRWWWNMPALERVMIVSTDDADRMAAFLGFLRQGLSEDDAAARVKKFYPICSSGTYEKGTSDDGVLPAELKYRVVEFIERNAKNPTAYKKLLERGSSFNAVFRQAMRQGQIPPGQYQTPESQREAPVAEEHSPEEEKSTGNESERAPAAFAPSESLTSDESQAPPQQLDMLAAPTSREHRSQTATGATHLRVVLALVGGIVLGGLIATTLFVRMFHDEKAPAIIAKANGPTSPKPDQQDTPVESEQSSSQHPAVSPMIVPEKSQQKNLSPGIVKAVSTMNKNRMEAHFEFNLGAIYDQRLAVYRDIGPPPKPPTLLGYCRVITVEDHRLIGNCEGFIPKIGDLVAAPKN